MSMLFKPLFVAQRVASCNVTTVSAVISAMTFSASGAAPTPLYQEYQSHFGLTPLMVDGLSATYGVPSRWRS